MSGNTLLLGTVVATALAFNVTNGFHDTAAAIATSIATKALKPKVAVSLPPAMSFVGAFLSLSVAATIASGIVDAGAITLTVVFAGLLGGITWNLVTWYLGIPSNSSHAFICGVIGATFVAAGADAVEGAGVSPGVSRDDLVAAPRNRRRPGSTARPGPATPGCPVGRPRGCPPACGPGAHRRRPARRRSAAHPARGRARIVSHPSREPAA